MISIAVHIVCVWILNLAVTLKSPAPPHAPPAPPVERRGLDGPAAVPAATPPTARPQM